MSSRASKKTSPHPPLSPSGEGAFGIFASRPSRPQDHCADPPPAVAPEELGAVDAAIQDFAVARPPRLMRAEHVRHMR